ncbi:MAG: tetratricopeptide repeat protein [Nitrospira sp.]|nr:tetratricopeptide repeat protein [Nitrospira sp.]
MSLEEIERLKEKLNKDPNSKLFILLAEEYKKEGMLDEAIAILTQGLERHPRYMSAHVSLGKIYLEKGILDKAKEEFKEVISAIPDNLYAHKKLAEIHKDLVEIDEAAKEFKMVLRLNPGDEEAANSLAEIEKGLTVKPEIPEKATSAETTYSKPEPALEEEKPPEIPITEQDIEYSSKTLFEEEEIEEGVTEQEGLPEEEIFPFEDIFKEIGVSDEEISEALKEGVFEQPSLSISDADQYIAQGKYMTAMDIYKKLLSTEPGNIHVMQRIEDIKWLLKLLGKDKEELIAKLTTFLDGIKKRRDEFFRNP